MGYLALDIGSSFIKAALLDLDRGRIGDYRIGKQLEKLPSVPGRFEVDAELLYREVELIIQGYQQEHPGQVEGILLATQMHGFVLSGPDGLPRSPYISWQDERCLEKDPCTGRAYMEVLTEMFPKEDMASSGVYIKPYLALCNLYAMIRQGFRIRAGTWFCTLGSYIIQRLTGNNCCHLTNAGPTGFADVVRCCWNEETIRKAGCGELEFPRIVRDLAPCGWYRADGREIPVYPDIGDHQGSVLGVLARPERDIVVNIGTAGQIARISRGFRPGEYECRPFFDGCYLNTVSRMPGGRNLDVLVGFLADAVRQLTGREVSFKDIWNRAVCLLADLDSGGLSANTSFHKTGRGEAGSIEGITFNNLTVKNMFAACIRDMGKAYQESVARVCPERSENHRLVFSGEFLHKTPPLQRAVGEACGLPQAPVARQEGIFLGMYRLALVCSGRCQTIEQTLLDPMVSRVRETSLAG